MTETREHHRTNPIRTILDSLAWPHRIAVVTAAALDCPDTGTDPYVVHVQEVMRLRVHAHPFMVTGRAWKATVWYVGEARPQRLASIYSTTNRDRLTERARAIAADVNADCGGGLPLHVTVTP